MKPVISIIQEQDFKTSQWSGGKTTEIAIFPEKSSYKDRSFIWRLSSAVMQDEKSVFTHLPDIKRHLMILDGSVYLSHDSKPKKRLEAFEQDVFDGASNTTCEGRACDFNLMTAANCKGSLEHLSCFEQSVFHIKPVLEYHYRIIAFYAVSGNFQIQCDNQIFAVKSGSLLRADLLAEEAFDFCLSAGSDKKTDIIKAEMLF